MVEQPHVTGRLDNAPQIISKAFTSPRWMP